MSSTPNRSVAKNSTSVSVIVRILGNVSFDPQVSVSDATGGLILRYRRDGETAVSIAPAALASLSTAWTSGGIKSITDGYYRVDVPNAAFAKAPGVNGVLITGAMTGMRVDGCVISLVDGDLSPFATTPQVY